MGVVGVELQPEVGRADLVQQGQCDREIVEEIARPVDGVDRLDGQLPAFRGFGGPGQVVGEDARRLGALGHTGHDVQPLRTQRVHESQAAPEGLAEPRLLPRHGGEARRTGRVG